MRRGTGVQISKSPYVNGCPIEYAFQSTNQSFAQNQLVKFGTTGGGKLDYADGSTYYKGGGLCISLKATTGSTTVLVPYMRVSYDVEYSVPVCTSDTVISTTHVTNHISVSSSGGALPGTTGSFRVTNVYNTSAVSAQVVTGMFMATTASTN